MIRVDVKPELLRWARERAGFDIDALARSFPVDLLSMGCWTGSATQHY